MKLPATTIPGSISETNDSLPRVLMVHAYYRQRGGEDVVAEQEAELLTSRGHTVERYSTHNRDIDDGTKVATALRTLWSSKTTRDITAVIAKFKPDVLHVHNTFPSISPSVYWAAAQQRVPVVQTLHNFRLLCPQAMLLRENKVCEDCIGRLPWRSIVHRCYHDSAAQSAVLTGMLALHRALGTYRNKVTRYVALNEFCMQKFIQGGLPGDKFRIKPNFADVPAPESSQQRHGALFAGRLSNEKGVHVLAKAIGLFPTEPVEVIGDGPERDLLQAEPTITLRGFLDQAGLFAAMRRSAYLVMPSIWYENAPRVLIEAFGCGLPVIASNLGALAGLVEHEHTGLLFEAGSASSLANAMRWAAEHPGAMRVMGLNARRMYEERYSPEGNHRQLLDIYRDAMQATPLAPALAVDRHYKHRPSTEPT
jgi:glycosyltransferase involved in cell wall biosynthesis